MFITTRVTEMTFPTVQANCTRPTTPACATNRASAKQFKYYVADVEKFTTKFVHFVQGPRTGINAQSREMEGSLLGPNDEVLVTWAKDYDPNTRDVLTVDQLLTAAGIDNLDIPSGVDASGSSLRYDGIIFFVYMEYKNSLSSGEIVYTYRVRKSDNSEHKQEEAIYVHYPDQLVVLNRHGIKLVFLQTGEIGKFSIQTLIINLVSGLVLIRLAATFVDLIAMYFMPLRASYKKHKYEQTEDYGDVRKGKHEAQMEDMEQRMRQMEEQIKKMDQPNGEKANA
jgi:hypothetical protein